MHQDLSSMQYTIENKSKLDKKCLESFKASMLSFVDPSDVSASSSLQNPMKKSDQGTSFRSAGQVSRAVSILEKEPLVEGLHVKSFVTRIQEPIEKKSSWFSRRRVGKSTVEQDSGGDLSRAVMKAYQGHKSVFVGKALIVGEALIGSQMLDVTVDFTNLTRAGFGLRPALPESWGWKERPDGSLILEFHGEKALVTVEAVEENHDLASTTAQYGRNRQSQPRSGGLAWRPVLDCPLSRLLWKRNRVEVTLRPF